MDRLFGAAELRLGSNKGDVVRIERTDGVARGPRSARCNRIVIAGRDSAQDSINQIGQEMTRRNMDIQPTLTTRPGLPVRIIVNRDLVLRPSYSPVRSSIRI